jgi:hypothetical protein
VEVRLCEKGWVHVRDSKDPSGPDLSFSLYEWIIFAQGMRTGEFELPLWALQRASVACEICGKGLT